MNEDTKSETKKTGMERAVEAKFDWPPKTFKVPIWRKNPAFDTAKGRIITPDYTEIKIGPEPVKVC